MKRIGLIVACILLFSSLTFANKLNVQDYPLTAKVLSTIESSVIPSFGTSTNPNTGVSNGNTTTYSRIADQEEVQIGNIVYITTVVSRGRINGQVGDSFPARFGTKRWGFSTYSVIYLLGKDKHGKPKEVALQIVGQRTL